MFGHGFLSGYSAKIVEYALSVGYLVLFVCFWRYVQGGKKVARPAAKALASKRSAGWLPASVRPTYHASRG